MASSPLLRAPRSEEELHGLAQEALAYAAANGLLMAAPKAQQPPSGQHTLFGHAPLALLPDPFPARQYLEARDLAPLFNTLVRLWAGMDLGVARGLDGSLVDLLMEPID